MAFSGGLSGKKLPGNAGDRFNLSGSEDPLKEEMTIKSSFLGLGIPWTEESGGYGPWGHKVEQTW